VRRTLAAAAICALVCVGCKDKDQRERGSKDLPPLPDQPVFETTSDEPVLLRYKFERGQRFAIQLDVDMDMQIQAEGRDVRIPITMTMEANFETTGVAPNDDFTLTARFTRMTVEATGPGGEVAYDSAMDRRPSDPNFRHLAVLLENPISVEVTPLGEVRDIDMHLLVDALQRAGAAALREEIERTTRQLMQSSFVQLSERPVRAGDTYDAGDIVQTLPNVGEMRMDAAYKILSVSGDKKQVLLRPMAEITIEPAAGAAAECKLNSTELNGWIVFDREVGNVMRSAAAVSLDMSVSAEGEKGDIKLDMDLKYRVK